MLKTINVGSLHELLTQTIPAEVWDKNSMKHDTVGNDVLPTDLIHGQFKKLVDKNKLLTTFIGEGFYGTIVPPVIERCFISNPGWYNRLHPISG